MPWTEQQHRRATSYVEVRQAARRAAGVPGVDPSDRRTIESLAVENTGSRLAPARHATGRRLDRTLRNGAYEVWSSIAWRTRLATVIRDRADRVDRLTGRAPR